MLCQFFTRHLTVDSEGGAVHVCTLDDADVPNPVLCGRITRSGQDRCWWPGSRLGEEPAWFAAEVDDLADRIAHEHGLVHAPSMAMCPGGNPWELITLRMSH